MAKLTKQERKLHEQALRLLDKEVLTDEEKCFVLDNWHEGATHMNGAVGAFFTPIEIASGVAIEAHGKRIIDLCAGIGRLAYTYSCYKNPFSDKKIQFDITCVEINSDYIEVGKKILPEARWIQADVMTLPADIGHFDCAIGNPPFGNIWTKSKSPRLTSAPFEYKVIDVASDIADSGVFIIPQGSAPFRISGVRSSQFDIETPAYKRFVKESDITLEPNCGIDTSLGAENWHGVKIATEIVCVDFLEALSRRNPSDVEDKDVDTVIDFPMTPLATQGELFPAA